jgi:hypothetical protein
MHRPVYRVHTADGCNEYRAELVTAVLHVPGFIRAYPNDAGRYMFEYERPEQAEAAAYRLWRTTGEQPAIQGYAPEIAPEVLLERARTLLACYHHQHEQYREGGDTHQALYYLAQRQALEELLAGVGIEVQPCDV